jgi:NTE family protein
MMRRRDILSLATAGAAATMVNQTAQATDAVSREQRYQAGSPTFALALGGGAARGIAHIPILEAFDELGIKPSVIAGTSIGSIIGACYASGLSGRDLREFAIELFEKRIELLRRLFAAPSGSWASIFQLSTSALIKPDRLLEIILPPNVPETFEDLKLPLKVVATDFFDKSAVVFESGRLLPAIGASSALPGLLSPVKHSDKLLIDGGFVNPTPSDIIRDQARYTIAIDLTGHQVRPGPSLPNAIEMLTGATQIALYTIAQTKLQNARPDLLIKPNVQDFDSMDFYKTKEILAAAEPDKEIVKRGIERLFTSGSTPAETK